VRIWQDVPSSEPTPSPSGSDVKFAQNAKVAVVLELDDSTEDELDEEDELDNEDELATVTGGVELLPPPPPPPQPIKSTDVAQKPNSRNRRIIFSLCFYR